MTIQAFSQKLTELNSSLDDLSLGNKSAKPLNKKVQELAGNLFDYIKAQAIPELQLDENSRKEVGTLITKFIKRIKKIDKYGGFIRWFRTSATKMALKPLVEPLRLIKQKFDPKYDKQVILALTTTNRLEWISERAEKSGLTNTVINLVPFMEGAVGDDPTPKLLKTDKLYKDELISEEAKTALASLTPKSRLYISAHGQAGLQLVGDDSSTRILTVSALVFMLKKYAPQLKNSDGKIKISLDICNAGKNSGEKKSFGFALSQALDKEGISADVYARTGFVRFAKLVSDFDHKKEVLKEKWHIFPSHHAQGSKLSFVTTNGNTVVNEINYDE